MDGHKHEFNTIPKNFDLESISLEEREGLLGPTPMGRQSSSTRRCRLWSSNILLSLLVAVNVILAALLASHLLAGYESSTDNEQHRVAQQPVPLGGLPTVDSSPSWLPPERWHTEVFRRQPIFGMEPSSAAHEAWRSLIPKGKGFVMVKNNTWLPNLPGLGHPNMREEQQACISVFHQLHCLYMTYTAYWNARDGDFDEVPPEHLIHCWDYLRQSIMCAGDTSLEWVSEYSHPPNATDGWGFQHTCKNFDAIYNWAEQHRSKDNVGIE